MIIAQFSAIPTPQIMAAASSQRLLARSRRRSLRRRYSSTHQTAEATSNKSRVSPVAAVACSQKLYSNPHITTASKVATVVIIFSRPEGRKGKLQGSSFMICASRPRQSAAKTADMKFSTAGIHPAGSSLHGSVSTHKTGWLASGCQSQPATFAVNGRLCIVTSPLNVTL